MDGWGWSCILSFQQLPDNAACWGVLLWNNRYRWPRYDCFVSSRPLFTLSQRPGFAPVADVIFDILVARDIFFVTFYPAFGPGTHLSLPASATICPQR